jgi:hypothetical protein
MSPVGERFDEQTALAYLEHLVREFATNRMATGQALRDLLSVTPELFLSAAWKILKKGDFSAGHRFLATLLAQNDNLVEKLCDPSTFTRQEAIAIARQVGQVDPLLDTKLARYLETPRSTPLDERVSGQVLELLDAVSEGSRLVPILGYLVNSPDLRLRSKAALLIGRRLQNPKWTWKRLEEVDGRVRANAIEALWGVDTKEARTVLWQACEDSANRVAGNALYGLYRLDELTAIPRLLAMAAHPEPAFRATAAWVMGHTGDPRFIEALGQGKQDDNPHVRKTSFFALMKLNQTAARAVAGERFELRVLRAGKRDDGACSLWVAVWTPEGIPASGLPKTAFVVRQGSHPLACSDVREAASPQSLVAGYGLCRDDGVSDQDMRAAEQGLVACLRFKRKGDHWAVAKLRPVGDTLEFSWQNKAERAQEADAVEEPVRLMAANSALEKAITSASARVTGNSAAGAALERLLSVAAPVRVPRHVILLIGAGSNGLDDIAAVRALHIPIHAIQAGPGPVAGNFAALARESGGLFIRTSSPEEIVDAYQRIYLSFLHHYELDFQDHAQDRGRVQIYASQGYGEASW